MQTVYTKAGKKSIFYQVGLYKLLFFAYFVRSDLSVFCMIAKF